MATSNVLLKSFENSCEINLYGATVVSWRYAGEELLFVSSKSHTDGKKAIRGGIPLVFPNFGPWDLGPQHGFARIQYWKVEEEPKKLENGNARVVLSLSDNEQTRAMWNHSFKLLFTVTLCEKSMKTDFAVENTGSDDFDFTCLLHTYFRVPDIAGVTVSGLQNLTYVDKVRGGDEFVEDRDLVTIAENVDRVYKSANRDHLITGGPKGHTLQLAKENLPDTVVWNPWAEKAAAMADFGDEEYPNMVCVEAGYVSQRYNLSPKTSFMCGQTITVLPKSSM